MTCSFIGHQKIGEAEEVKSKLYKVIEKLIVQKNVDEFLFESNSDFDKLCYEVVSELMQKYPYIKRIYIRAEYPYIHDDYKNILLKSYEDTYFPERIVEAGKAVYVERNCEMIDKSDFCVMYYDENYMPSKRKSGTKIAYDYAVRKKKRIINIKKRL